MRVCPIQVGQTMAPAFLRSIIALLILLCPVGASAELAWWLTARFAPSANAIEGIPIGRIDGTWVAASPLAVLPLPPEASAPGESVREHDGFFSLEHDFDHDGDPEKAIVGVYRTRENQTGRFLVILNGGPKPSQVHAVFTIEGAAGFSVLYHEKGEVSWSTCMECDVFSIVRFSAGVYRLEHFSCEDCG